MAFPLWTEEHEAFREMVGRFARDEIRPHAERRQEEASHGIQNRGIGAGTKEIMREIISRHRMPAGSA